jgi:hypothetical protein
MPEKRLHEALDALHEQLESTEELSERDRAKLVATMDDIRDALASDERELPATEGALGRRIYALIQDLESTHPKFADILRNVSESLSNLGI